MLGQARLVLPRRQRAALGLGPPKVEKPKAQAKLELWRAPHPGPARVGAPLLFASAVSGFPPFAIVAVLAGQLRMNVGLFLGVGIVGRTLRFAAFLGGAAWLTDLFELLSF